MSCLYYVDKNHISFYLRQNFTYVTHFFVFLCVFCLFCLVISSILYEQQRSSGFLQRNDYGEIFEYLQKIIYGNNNTKYRTY